MAYRIGQTDALLQRVWNSKLWNESQEEDIYSGSVGTYSGKSGIGRIPDAAIMRVTLPAGANDYTVGMVLGLTGAGREGAGKQLVGFTESMSTRFFRCYANDERHGVDTEQYGFHAHLNEGYGILNEVNRLLGEWFRYRRGRHVREAILESYSSNLEEAPSSRTKHWNRHIAVKNVNDSAQPDYDSTLGDYTSNLVTALTAAGTGTGAQADNAFFTWLEYKITNDWKIMPFDDGSYIVTVPSPQAVYLKTLNNTNESFANYMKDAHVAKYVEAAYGNYLTKFGKLHLVEDTRAPVIDHTTATGTLTAYYRDVGSTDNRTSAAGDVYTVGAVHGKSSITEAIAMKPRYDVDISDFERLKSYGVSASYGFQVTEFDADTATDNTKIGQSCAVWLAAKGDLTA